MRRSLLFSPSWILGLALSTTAFALHGELQSATEYFPDSLGAPTEQLIPRFSLELDQDGKFNKTYRYSFKGTFQTNTASTSQPEQYFGDLSEAYLEMKKHEFRARVGWNTVNWGVMDIYSPMDVVNQNVFFDPLASKKRGSPMVELQYAPAGWSFSALYIPCQPLTMLPSADSRWYPRGGSLQNIPVQFQDSPALVEMPTQPTYNIASPIQLSNALNNNFGFNINKQWDWLDVHAMYFNGASATPGVSITGTSLNTISLAPLIEQATDPIQIHQVIYRVETTGIGFSATAGQVIVRGESVYNNSISSSDGSITPWSFQNGLGLEKNWEVGSTTVTQLVHYYRALYPDSDNNLPMSSFRLFEDTAMMGARWAITDDRFFYGSALYDFLQEGIFWMVGAQTKIIDSVRADLSWRQLSANKPGLIQTFEHNQNARLELTYFF